MKHCPWIFASTLSVLLLGAACHSAHTQPQVITVPQDETSHPPTTYVGQSVEGDSTPAMETKVVEAPSTKLSYNSCTVEGPFIAMTFDDGPKPGQTDRLLDMLKARNIKATFFVIGQNAAAYPELIRRILAEGHEIGNHTWSHLALNKLSPSGVAAQINQTDAALAQAGAPRPTLMRPPYGATNATLNRRLNQEFGHTVIMWDVDPLDWKVRNSAHVTSEILKNTKPGSIVLSHDIHPTTIDAMPATLDALQQKGFKFVTVSELIAMDRPQLAKKEPAPKAQ